MDKPQTGFIQVYTSTDANSVHLAQTLLQNEGIVSTIEGEVLGQVMIGYQGLTWVKLLVPISEAERAREILREASFAPDEAEAFDAYEAEAERNRGKKITRILLLILLVLALLAAYTYFVQAQ